MLAGDSSAYTPLVNRHYEPCARFARRMLGNAEDAEDVVQETFVRAYLALGRYQERDRFRSWLFSILVNQCRSLGRKRARVVRHQREEAAVHEEPWCREPDSSDRDVLQRALRQLDEPHREALLLKYGEDLEYEEMARLTGDSVPALKMRVKRARDQVRPMLEGLLHD